MKITKLCSLVVALALLLPLVANAKEDLNAKVADLQKQIDALRAEQKNSSINSSNVSSKTPVEVYGFVAAQFFEGTARTQMYGGLNSVATQSRVINKTAPYGGRHTWFGATPQNSRVGLMFNKAKVSDVFSMGGNIELDFVNVINQTSYGTAPIPRIRLIFAELSSDRSSFVFGQNWELFSPLNSSSLSLGGNLWFQGNLGTRKPQASFAYNVISNDTDRLKLAVSANLPQNTDDLVYSNGATGSGINSGLPLGEMLAQFNHRMKHGDLIAAVSGALGANSVNGKYKKQMGVAASLAIPFHKLLRFSGEVHYGQDMGNFLSYANAVGNAYGVREVAGWAQISSQWCSRFDTALGFAIDDIKKEKVAVGNVTRNQNAFINFRFFPVKPFYIGLEYNNMRTTYKGSGTSTANIIFSNMVYYF